MNHIVLNLYLQENSLNCIFKSGKAHLRRRTGHPVHYWIFRLLSISSQNLLVLFTLVVVLRISLAFCGDSQQVGVTVALSLQKGFVCDFDDHFREKFNLIKFLELIINIPCTHSTGIERNHLFLDSENILLIFGNQLWLRFTIAVM